MTLFQFLFYVLFRDFNIIALEMTTASFYFYQFFESQRSFEIVLFESNLAISPFQFSFL